MASEETARNPTRQGAEVKAYTSSGHHRVRASIRERIGRGKRGLPLTPLLLLDDGIESDLRLDSCGEPSSTWARIGPDPRSAVGCGHHWGKTQPNLLNWNTGGRKIDAIPFQSGVSAGSDSNAKAMFDHLLCPNLTGAPFRPPSQREPTETIPAMSSSLPEAQPNQGRRRKASQRHIRRRGSRPMPFLLPARWREEQVVFPTR